ncbi:MAG: hypothetical protein R3D59_10365 [Paracoccaceae bacterium]
MTMVVTTAPACWGVDDVSNPHLPDWRRVLEEAGKAGYGGLELGPYGYMPLDVTVVGAELAKNGLHIVAGTIFNDLVDPGKPRRWSGRPGRHLRAGDSGCRNRRSMPGQRFEALYSR